MKTRTISLIAAFCLSGLIMRLYVQDRKIVRQQEQIAVVEQRVTEVRKAFDRIRFDSIRLDLHSNKLITDEEFKKHTPQTDLDDAIQNLIDR
jgi:hypothetical protein